jgi:catechol 2,3-dioxygenase-like lactoylglutathione lyase family enzyme
MSRIVQVDPIFAVSDLPRAIEHYKKLGFEISEYDEAYAFAHRDGLTLHLHLTDAPTPGCGLLYLHVDDANSLADEWRTVDASLVAPEDVPWGKHETSHTDPDGNTIRFGSPSED